MSSCDTRDNLRRLFGSSPSDRAAYWGTHAPPTIGWPCNGPNAVTMLSSVRHSAATSRVPGDWASYRDHEYPFILPRALCSHPAGALVCDALPLRPRGPLVGALPLDPPFGGDHDRAYRESRVTLMGTRVIVGVPFERDAFIRETPRGMSKCPNEHMAKGGNFCSECGLALTALIDRSPTAALVLLADVSKVSLAVWLADFPHGFIASGPRCAPSIGPMLITTSDDGDDQTGNLAFGCLVTETLTFIQMTDMFARVEVVAAKYGLESPVALILGHAYD